MLTETKGTVPPQQKVTRNFSKNFSTMRKTLDNNDVALFLCLQMQHVLHSQR